MKDSEIRTIEEALLARGKDHLDVLEWGSGGSTQYFPRILRDHGISYSWTSIEYNKKWYEQVKEKVGSDPQTEVVLFDVGNEALKQRKTPMDEYVRYPKTLGKKFDLILVDGRKRRRCVLEAQRLLKEGGVVFLHDAERPYYHCVFKCFPDSRMVGRRLWRGSNTYVSLWQRIKNILYSMHFTVPARLKCIPKKRLLFASAYGAIRIANVLFPARNAIPVLMYHRVNDEDTPLSIHTELFRFQMKTLAEQGYETISLDALFDVLGKKKCPKAKQVVITFDDGYKDNLTHAQPIMDTYGFTGAVFVATKYIGDEHAFSSREDPEGYAMLTRNDLKMLEEFDWDVANHFHSHRKLVHLSDEKIKEEVSMSQGVLNDILVNKENCARVALPHDRVNEHVRGVLAKEGIEMVFEGKGIARATSDVRGIPRTEIPNTSSRIEFLAYLSPWYYRLVPLYFALKKIGLFRSKN